MAAPDTASADRLASKPTALRTASAERQERPEMQKRTPGEKTKPQARRQTKEELLASYVGTIAWAESNPTIPGVEKIKAACEKKIAEMGALVAQVTA